jgi:hypothetical protein
MLNQQQCADYDSMGNHGRFPKTKPIKKGFISNLLKNINNFFYVKRR